MNTFEDAIREAATNPPSDSQIHAGISVPREVEIVGAELIPADELEACQ